MFEDYEQIMKHAVKPIFQGGTSYCGDLKYAKEESKEHEFWHWAADKFGGEDELFITVNMEEVSRIILDFFAGNLVLFTGDTMALTIRSTVCELFDRT